MVTAGNFTRRGVVAGFALQAAPYSSGLTPGLWRGVLFAGGNMYRPGSDPTPGDAPDDSLSYLCYADGSGFYYSTSADGDDPDDAVLGWVLTAAGEVVAVSSQDVVTGGGTTLGGGGLSGGTTGGSLSGGGGSSSLAQVGY